MTLALKPFQNSHTRQLVNPGDPVIGYSETELDDLARNGLVPRVRAPVVAVVGAAVRATAAAVSPVLPVRADNALDVPTAAPVAPATKRTLRSAVGGE